MAHCHPRTASPAIRGGFALVAALLLVLLMALLAAAMLAIGTQQRRIARLHTGAVRARSAAEAGVRIAAADWDPALDSLAAGSTLAPAGAGGTWADGTTRAAVVERLGSGGFLLAGRGAAADGAVARATARLVTTDPLRMWADASAAITTGGDLELLPGTAVDGTVGPPPTGWSTTECPAAAAAEQAATIGAGDRPAILADSAATLTIDPTAALTGAPPVLKGSLQTAPLLFDGLGALRSTDLALLADHFVSGAITPGPTATGSVCDTTSIANWGDPLSPGSACGAFRPIIFAPADLHVSGGAGQGILVVMGDLVLSAGFEFRGLVLVAGSIDVSSATIHGAIRVSSGLTPSRFGGHIRHDACALWRAFHSASLKQPFRIADRWWLPAF